MDLINLLELLDYIDPGTLDYQDWVNVGMALKHEGYSLSEWEAWSKRDIDRYREGECQRKWQGFQGSNTPVTAGTLVALAKDHGWVGKRPQEDGWVLSWDDVIGQKKEHVVIDHHYLEADEVHEPKRWNPARQLIDYLETLFESTDHVGYVTESFEIDGRKMPKKGKYQKTAGELIENLNRYGNDIGASLGDYNPEVGAWIRFNPLDGQGVKDANVTDYRYALVESDTVDIDKQNAIIRELELPVACLVHSGNKSIHAIVKVDATDYQEYRKRVDYLYNVCQKNGLRMDTQNRNPSRLSQMPGVMRNGKKQWLMARNIGKANWAEWHDWIESVNDDLPDPEKLGDVWENLPPLAPSLIDGILRQGHKMLLAGPSKAGKSYSLIGLATSIAEGKEWLGWNCTQGRVLYVNLELDRASCLNRFKDVYEAKEWSPKNINNIDIWNLRGKAVPMDKLAPKLIRRAAKRNYIAVIIDPIYKVITGDENSADQMAHFTNQFDKVCTELGTAVIYCHHHSKGYQGNKRSMDRASGSGVFARDPDVLLDLVELEIPDMTKEIVTNEAINHEIYRMIKGANPSYDKVTDDDKTKVNTMLMHASNALKKTDYDALQGRLDNIRKQIDMRSAWRIDGTLREFPKFQAIDIWFDYPTHKVDKTGLLKDLMPESVKPNWQKGVEARKTPEENKKERVSAIEIAYSKFELEGVEEITLNDLADEMDVSKQTVKRRMREHKGFEITHEPGKDAIVTRKA